MRPSLHTAPCSSCGLEGRKFQHVSSEFRLFFFQDNGKDVRAPPGSGDEEIGHDGVLGALWPSLEAQFVKFAAPGRDGRRYEVAAAQGI